MRPSCFLHYLCARLPVSQALTALSDLAQPKARKGGRRRCCDSLFLQLARIHSSCMSVLPIIQADSSPRHGVQDQARPVQTRSKTQRLSKRNAHPFLDSNRFIRVLPRFFRPFPFAEFVSTIHHSTRSTMTGHGNGSMGLLHYSADGPANETPSSPSLSPSPQVFFSRVPFPA